MFDPEIRQTAKTVTLVAQLVVDVDILSLAQAFVELHVGKDIPTIQTVVSRDDRR